jgi:transglutaminase-like putative cysteine protease
MVLENRAGNEYIPLLSEQVTVSGISDKTLYTSSIQSIDYASSKTAVKDLSALVAPAGSDQEKLDIVYNYIINNISYDFAKAGNAAALVDYLPVLDTIYSSKKGICYDYASLLASALRKNGIPCKLQMGYCSEIPEYHAWNEIYVGGSWFKVDTTYDSQVVKANLEVTMKKANNSYQVVKYY